MKNENTAASKNITIREPNKPATPAQRKVIGHAVKEGQYKRFDAEAWKRLTKGEAAAIITGLRGNTDDAPATDAQKKKLADLIHRGFHQGLKRETFSSLTSYKAKMMIYHAVLAEKENRTVEGYAPRQRLAPNAPVTERQKARLQQLVADGFIERIPANEFRKLTHEKASEYITRGKQTQYNASRQAA